MLDRDDPPERDAFTKRASGAGHDRVAYPQRGVLRNEFQAQSRARAGRNSPPAPALYDRGDLARRIGQQQDGRLQGLEGDDPADDAVVADHAVILADAGQRAAIQRRRTRLILGIVADGARGDRARIAARGAGQPFQIGHAREGFTQAGVLGGQRAILGREAFVALAQTGQLSDARDDASGGVEGRREPALNRSGDRGDQRRKRVRPAVTERVDLNESDQRGDDDRADYGE